MEELDSLWIISKPTQAPMKANSTDIVAAIHDPDTHPPIGMPIANMQINRMSFIWRGDTPLRPLIYAMALMDSPAVISPVTSILVPSSSLGRHWRDRV
ncbi:hypothetical protein [Luteibacter sp. 9135]|uniref:hypothetical protein n=1 Tax=Luteibacter sp. 9135 TaxID=1500893 RepID=UPI001639C409|nr:hypothetical protein [Luteibacter sp. 9135]